MAQPAMIVAAQRDEEEALTGYNIIKIPTGGEPGNAGRELLKLTENDQGRRNLERDGFRQIAPEPRPGTSYKELVLEATNAEIHHIYRLEDGTWEYQNTNCMWRGCSLTAETVDMYEEMHRTIMRYTIIRPEDPETAPAQLGDCKIS